MASPPKPWTNVNSSGLNFRSSSTPSVPSTSGYAGSPLYLHSAPVVPPSSGGSSGVGCNHIPAPNVSQVPPPVPPRPDQVNTTYRYGLSHRGFPSYSGYTNSMYPNMYRSYGGIGYGNRVPYTSGFYGDSENELVRFAEESTRPAFQSIESVVQAVGSVSMMLESTFHALYSSYQAVLGVADQFTRLRNHLTHILSTLAVLRSLQWLCLKILYHLGVRSQNPSNESVWLAAAEMANPSEGGGTNPHRSSWPIFIFLGVVLGAPWVILRLLSKAAELKKKELDNWAAGKEKPSLNNLAVVLYDFSARSPQELSVRAGQRIAIGPKNVQPKTKGWVLASVDGHKVGLVPVNYLKMVISPKNLVAQLRGKGIKVTGLPVVQPTTPVVQKEGEEKESVETPSAPATENETT